MAIEFELQQNGFYLIRKDPNAVKQYGRDWTDRLPAGETIAEVEWFAFDLNWDTTDDLIIHADPPYVQSHTDTQASCWISGGVVDEKYFVTCRITTDGVPPMIDDDSFLIHVKER